MMIDFSKAYSRADFVNYLRRDFLPDDFEQGESNVPFWAHMNYASAATCLGKSKTLDLVVYEIKHTSRHGCPCGFIERCVSYACRREAIPCFGDICS